MEIRKARLEKAWPPSDRQVGVILVAHSMGQVEPYRLISSAFTDHPKAVLSPARHSFTFWTNVPRAMIQMAYYSL